MRQKELRIALICYGGVSLAVYMHGVTKELWKLARASRDFITDQPGSPGSQAVYRSMLEHLRDAHGLRLRVLPDIVAGASAGGINGVFLAQAIHSGQSLEPLTQLWLERADVDVLTDPDARPWSRFAKLWAQPLAWWILRRPGNVVSASVAPETRAEVRNKLSRLVRSRWFEPPFGGLGFSRLLADALEAMAATEPGPPLLPPGHPLDVFVTATDFKGHLEPLRLNSPPLVEESEHRVSLGFRALTPSLPGTSLAPLPELIFAARATASFPGAFPPLQLAEIDALAAERGLAWHSRAAFVARTMPEHARRGDEEGVALIDGSVLVNAPFAEAMAALRNRPSHRDVDRRFVYIDPHPDPMQPRERRDPRPPGFFAVIFGALSAIPREQPVRDNLDQLARQSREMQRLRTVIDALRPEVEGAVSKLFGHTLFFDKPTVKRLAAWRNKAHDAAAQHAGYAYLGYAQIKFAGVIDALAALIYGAAPELGLADAEPLARHLRSWLAGQLVDPSAAVGSAFSPATVAFFRDHDLGFRIRRLRLLARRLSADWRGGEGISEAQRNEARDMVYRAQAIYFAREAPDALGPGFAAIAAQVWQHPGVAMAYIARCRDLRAADAAVDALLAEAMAPMPRALRRQMLLTYLGFAFYDTATLPLLRGEGLTEFDPVKVDRISPDDARAIRSGGVAATLRGVEFFNFGAFFSRAYRENDYLWGRLHGAERMIDLIASTLPEGEVFAPEDLAQFKHAAFLAVLDEEDGRLLADRGLVAGIRAEVLATGPG